MKNKLLFVLILGFFFSETFGQNPNLINESLLLKKWDANWICHPEHNGNKIGVYLFRKDILVLDNPEHYIVHVSADNRYKFYVNGRLICLGPARGNLNNWYFETIDIAPYLSKGENTISAKVWNYGWYKPAAQISKKTGFILQGNTNLESIANTDETWKVLHDTSYSVYRIEKVTAYMAGPGEKMEMDKHPWGWENAGYDITNWKNAKPIGNGIPLRALDYGIYPSHILYPREIPLMEYKEQKFQRIRKCEGINSAEELITGKDFQIDSHSKVKIILDQNELTNAYSFLRFSKGKDSEIKISYAESFFIPRESKEYKSTKDQEKGNRENIEGKVLIGNYDIIIPDGGNNRIFESNWWRVFRYVQLEIETKDSPLIIHQISSNYTAYPFVEKASFNSGTNELDAIWKTSWHTQKLCAAEIFMDCPYYEQNQYIGDTRIQALNSFYMTGDSLLWKKAINDFYLSRDASGMPNSSAPSAFSLIIPTFSLFWVHMVCDYNLHCNNNEYVDKLIPAVIDVLNWFEDRRDSSGLLTNVEQWNFIDWVKDTNWNYGVAPNDSLNRSALLNFLYSYTLNRASDMLGDYGYSSKSNEFKAVAKYINSETIKTCWDDSLGLVADNSEKNCFSQHTQAMAVLSNALSKENQRKALLNSYMNDSLISATYYFKFYYFEALKHAGLSNLYLEMLNPRPPDLAQFSLSHYL